MNQSLAHKLSLYRLALDISGSSQSPNLSVVALISMVKSLIDLLIEQDIIATLWVKLPPGNLWYSEIQRYQSWVSNKGGEIYTYEAVRGQGLNEEIGKYFSFSTSEQGIYREYFLIVTSPQLCSLILAYRPSRPVKQYTANKKNAAHKSQLLTLISFSGKVIQTVLNGIKKTVNTASEAIFPTSLNFIDSPEPSLITKLLLKQLQQQDILNTEIKSQRLARIKAQNLEVQKNFQSQSNYLNRVCQELRNPLTHMKTAISLLNSPTLKTTQRQRYLQMVKQECDHQNDLITGILDLLELERNLKSPVFESVRVNDVVPGVVSTYQPLAQERGVMLAYTLANDLPAVSCVSGGLKQIVINLLSNGIKFTPNGGQVWVRGSVQGNFVQLEFKDNGIGIVDSELNKIFDHFYRVRSIAEDPGGVGLGLTVIKQLLSSCGGTISVKSKPLEGSTFTVQLPIYS